MRRVAPFLAIGLLAMLAVFPRALAQGLPDLGDISGATLSPQMERKIGESVVRSIRLRDPTYLDDPEVQDYLRKTGGRIVEANPDARGEFEFFAMRDPSINAFALPGGFIGIHSGLITASDSESELASVLAHEVAHVTQRHIARQVADQDKLSIPVMLGVLGALLASRSNPDLAMGAATIVQGVAAQRFLNDSRDCEREADRVGQQSLNAAGFDPRAMPVFFEKMQRATRVMDDGSFPGYLRTHPMNTERIADAQNRGAALPYRQHVDSIDYHLVRAKLRAEHGDPADAVTNFAGALRDRRYANEAGARYGHVVALARAQRPQDAWAEMGRLRALKVDSPMIETLAARLRQMLGDAPGAIELLRTAMAKYPSRRPLVYAYLGALQLAGRHAEAAPMLAEQVRLYPRDERIHGMQAKTAAELGKRVQQHRAQAEVYALQGNLRGAIEQLQFAQTAGDGDFYEMSAVDARLRVLRDAHAIELKDQKKR
jgi:predicted Zn-dependent protease